MTGPSTIIVVEDSRENRELVAAYLRQEGYHVLEAENGTAFHALLETVTPELVILDIQLPDIDGLTLALETRRRSDAGIIFVTARDNDFDRVAALELGGDDYVTKPVNLRELLARIRSVLRRSARAAPGMPQDYRLAQYRLDLVRRELLDGNGARVTLTTGEFNVLAALVVHAGEPVTREYLLESIGPRDALEVSERTVDTLIRRLRSKLEPDPKRPQLILTVHGVGYQIAD